MKYSTTLLAFAATLVSAQYDKDWSSKYGQFEISTKNVSDATFDAPTKLASCDTNPIITLNNGVLIDQDHRQAEVVANDQFQFDSPLQDQRKYIDGFSIYTDPSNANKVVLAHPDGKGGSNTTFFSCNSGSFSNLYDDNIDGKCVAIYIQILPCGNGQPAYANSRPGDQASGGATANPTADIASTTPISSTPASSTPASSTPVTTSSSSTSTSSSSTVVPPTTPSSTPVVASPTTIATIPTAAPIPVPYPTGGNSTSPSASGTGSPSSTAPGTSKTSPLTAPAGGAEALAAGSKFGVAVVALIAFAML